MGWLGYEASLNQDPVGQLAGKQETQPHDAKYSGYIPASGLHANLILL